MEYRQLGSTGLRVSRVFLGGGNFGGVGSHPAFFGMGESESEAFALLDHAYEIGINVIDTADAYGGGRSESMIGSWLKAKGSHVRDQMMVATKVFNRVGDGPNDWGLSRRHIVRQVERSLKRLGAEAIDLYLIHEPDRSTPLEESLSALDDLVHQGKVRYLGASNLPAWLVMKALWMSDKYGLARFEWIQNSYNLLDRGDERELFPLLEDQGLGYTPFGPLAGGWLTGIYRKGLAYEPGSRMGLRPEPYRRFECDAVYEKLEQLRTYAQARDHSMGAMALAWLLGHPNITAPIVGPSRLEHFAPIEEALRIKLSSEERCDLDTLFALTS